MFFVNEDFIGKMVHNKIFSLCQGSGETVC